MTPATENPDLEPLDVCALMELVEGIGIRDRAKAAIRALVAHNEGATDLWGEIQAFAREAGSTSPREYHHVYERGEEIRLAAQGHEPLGRWFGRTDGDDEQESWWYEQGIGICRALADVGVVGSRLIKIATHYQERLIEAREREAAMEDAAERAATMRPTS